jgi:WD40 repeat protein
VPGDEVDGILARWREGAAGEHYGVGQRRYIKHRRGGCMRYAAFISYKHSPASRPQAEQLESALKKYAKPLWKPPVSIFRDERVLRPGDDLPVELHKALRESTYLLYLADKDAAASKWIIDELQTWCADLKRSDRLLIVHIGDRITVRQEKREILWEETDALPSVLKPYIHSIPVWVDLTWATAREQRDLNNIEYRKHINAISAVLRGKTPGDMNDDEVLTHRRNIRIRNLGIAALAVFAFLTTIFGAQARSARKNAEAQLEVATARQLAGQSNYLADTEPDTAALLAVASMRFAQSFEGRRELYARWRTMRSILRIVHGFARPIDEAIAFSPGGRFLAAGGWEGQIFVWRVADGGVHAKIPASKAPINQVAVSADGRFVAWSALGIPEGPEYQRVFVWDRLAPQRIRSIDRSPAYANGLVFNPDSTILAIGGSDGGDLLLRDIGRGMPGPTVTFPKGATFRPWAFSPDGKLLYLEHENAATVELVAMDVTHPQANIRPLGVSLRDLMLLGVANSPADGSLLLHLTRPQVLKRANDPETEVRRFGRGAKLAEGDQLYVPPASRPGAVALGSDSTNAYLAEGYDRFAILRRVPLTETDGIEQVRQPNTDRGLFTPDGKWRISKAKGILRIQGAGSETDARVIRPEAGKVLDFDISADGRTLVAAYASGREEWTEATSISVTELPSGRPLATMPLEPPGLRTLRVAPDGSRIAMLRTENADVVLSILRFNGNHLVTETRRVQRKEPYDNLPYLAFDRVGKQLAVFGEKVWLFAIPSLAPLPSVPDSAERLLDSIGTFSPDGKRLAVARDVIRVWDIHSKRIVATLGEQQYPTAMLGDLGINPYTDLVFTGDGRMVASSGGKQDTLMRLWDVERQEVVTDYGDTDDRRPNRELTLVDSARLLRYSDGDVVLPLDLGVIITEICSKVGRPLSGDEWKKYVGTLPPKIVCP